MYRLLMKTLQICLKEPYAPFISMFTFAPLPAHLLEDVPVAELEAHPYSQELSKCGSLFVGRLARAGFMSAPIRITSCGKPQ